MNSIAAVEELVGDRVEIMLVSISVLPGFDRQKLFSGAFGVICCADHPFDRNWHYLWKADLLDVGFMINGQCGQIANKAFQPILAAASLILPDTAYLLGLL